MLSSCLIFCRFQPGVAYKSAVYKKESTEPVWRSFVKNVSQINSQENSSTRVLFKKIVGWKLASYKKKRLQSGCFPVNFAKFLSTPISKNIFERLLLDIDYVTK